MSTLDKVSDLAEEERKHESRRASGGFASRGMTGVRSCDSGRSGVWRGLIASARAFGFGRNAATLTIGTAAAQAFSILAAPALTRLYPAAAIGQLALFTSFMSVAVVGVSLKFELGVVSASSPSEAAELTYASILLSGPMSIMSGLVLFALIRHSWLGFEGLPAYSALIMAGALVVSGVFTALRYWIIRKERFGLISRATVGQHAMRAVSQVCFGAMGGGAAGLMSGELLGRSVGLTSLMRYAWPEVRQLTRRATMWGLLRTLKLHRQLVVYSLPSTFIDTFVASMPIPIIAKLYGLEDAGYFALVQRILAVPLGLISASVADTFHSSLALCARDDPSQLHPLFRRTALGLFAAGLVPSLLLAFFGRPIVSLIFGRDWAIAGTLGALSAPWFLSQFVVSPLSRLVFVLRGQELKLVYDVAILSAMILVTGAAMWRHLSLYQTVMAFSLSNTAAYVLYFLLLSRIAAKGAALVH